MTVPELYKYIDNRIPSSLSLDRDNDGLMCCPDPGRAVKNILCVLDVTPDAVDYAAGHNFDVIVSHHPLIFKPLSAILSPKLIKLIKNDIAVMSFHTRFDIVNGGINDFIASMLNLCNIETFAEGAGRIGTLEEPVLFDSFGAHLKNILAADRISAVCARQTVHKIAVVTGSGGEFIPEAISRGSDTFISGECGYHRLLDAKEAGINTFEAGHFFTERYAAVQIRDIIIEAGITAEVFEQNEILLF